MIADLRFALRSLAKSPVFTFIAVMTLALGIGANAGVFSYLSTLLRRPLPLPGVSELVFMGEYSKQVPNMSVSYPNYIDWRDRQKSFTHLGLTRGQSFNYVGRAETERIRGAFFTHDTFQALGVSPVIGRWFGAEDDRPGSERTVLISTGLWQRAFGSDPGVLHDKITLSGETYSIIGVMPSDFRFPSSGTDVWVPWGLFGDDNMERGNHPGLYAIGRLKPGVTLDAALADMKSIAKQLELEYPQTNTGNSVTMQPIVDVVFGPAKTAVWVSFAAAFGVLMIACANVANLLLARAASRAREFAVRTAIGAGRSRLIRLVLAESLLLGIGGTLLGLLVGYATMQGIRSLIPESSPFVTQVHMDATVFAFAVVIGVGVTTLFGLVPAFTGSRINLNEALSYGSRTAGGHAGTRWCSCSCAA